MANQVSSVDVPLSLFSGWDTELSPPDIPEGASPANNDAVFTPGSVATRPGVNRIFATPLSSLGPFSYEKSFVLPSGAVKNLYLTKGDGILWVEDIQVAPGTAVSLFQSSGATYASSCTAQGREYIALSDGVHGADIPLCYDGTNLWRVSQDGPASVPTVQSVALPSVSVAAASLSYSISSAFPIGSQLYYALATPVSTITFGTSLVVTGTSISAYDLSGVPVDVYLYPSGLVGAFTLAYSGSNLGTATGGSVALPAGVSISRANNQLTVNTASAHGMQIGYQAQLQGNGVLAVGSGIVSISLNNEENPGLATVTTGGPHGLLPNNQVNIQGVSGATVGTAITNIAYAGGFVTITTSAAHGLSIGSEVTIAAGTATWANGQWSVAAVPSATTFTFAFVSYASFSSTTYSYSASDTGTVTYIWPLASTDPSQNYFTVQTCPTPDTFTIALSYTDGTWTGGSVTFPWDGIFYITATPSATTFVCQQYGPSGSTSETSGTATPYGQMAPGVHQLQVSFLLLSGAITAPGPPITFVANGGQYCQVSNLPTGPSNTAGRILEFTGAGGAYFYYIDVPAQVNGIVVSTATQINDNTTTSILLDFSDNTLYAATSVSKPGNNLSAQQTLAPCAGFFTYASRLLGWGQANKINNLLNPGFDGGAAGTNGGPPGWNLTLGSGASSALANGRVPGFMWKPSFTSSSGNTVSISQSAYVDAYNAPIVLPNTLYSFRAWIKGTTGEIQVTISSVAGSFSLTVGLFPATSVGAWITIEFPSETPGVIPSDTLLTISAISTGVAGSPEIDEVELIYTDEPFLDNETWISYVENLNAFDGDTGVIGPEDDLSPIRNFGVIRQSLYIVTGTGLHQTQDNGQTEPNGWGVLQIADNCGAFSVASIARNPQGIGSAGKDWMMWSGPDGAQLFTGQKPYKVSQEIQSVWDAIPAATAYQCWTKNYESAKWCFFGIPTPSGSMQVLVLDYRNIDGGSMPEYPPIHISFTGKMIVSDLTRKWTSWTLPAWCGELMYRGTTAQPQIVFGCETPAGAANAYLLNAAQYHDDDFGYIPFSYTTYFFVSHEMEQALQVGSHRHVYTLAQAYVTGTGTWSLSPLMASLGNPASTYGPWPLSTEPNFDVDFGINVETTRCAFTIQAQPTSGTDAYIKVQKLVINMAPAPWAKVRGSMTGSF